MSNALTVRREEATLVSPDVFSQAWQLAQAMAGAKSLPAHLQGSPADCLRVVELAFRSRQSPYAIADKTYFVQGKIAFEGQLCAALVNAHPSIETRLNYAYEGNEDKPDTLVCVVSAKFRGEDEPRTVRVTWKQGQAASKGARDKWASQPAQQLAYYGARVWGRRHAPEILMGIYTPEELAPDDRPLRDVTPHDPETGEVEMTAEERRAAMESEEPAAEPERPAMLELWLGPKDRRTCNARTAAITLGKHVKDVDSIAEINDLTANNEWIEDVEGDLGDRLRTVIDERMRELDPPDAAEPSDAAEPERSFVPPEEEAETV